MEFIDPKEEVIKLELTRFGKKQFSSGKFNPKFYAFSDQGVLYDDQFASGSEQQNSSGDRIYNETSTILTNIGNYYSHGSGSYEQLDKQKERETLSHLGTIQTYSTESSNLKFVLLNGFLETISTIQQGHYVVSASIYPSVERLHSNAAGKDRGFSLFSENALEKDEVPNEIKFSDGSKAIYVDDYFLFQTEEEHVKFDKENFEIKVFDMDANRYISFSEELDNIETVEYFFDFLFDGDIPDEIMCKFGPQKKGDIYQDNLFECNDNARSAGTNIYKNLDDFEGIC